MAVELGTHPDLPEDLSSPPSTRVRRLSIGYNSSSRGIRAFGFPGHQYSHAHIPLPKYTDTQLYISKIITLSKNPYIVACIWWYADIHAYKIPTHKINLAWHAQSPCSHPHPAIDLGGVAGL